MSDSKLTTMHTGLKKQGKTKIITRDKETGEVTGGQISLITGNYLK